MSAAVWVPVWILGAGGLGLLVLSLLTHGGSSAMGSRGEGELRPRL